MKLCCDCNTEKPLTDYYKVKTTYFRRCKSCHSLRSISWAKDNPEKVRNHRQKQKLKDKYGISVEQYNKMYANQNGACYLCNKVPDRQRALNVDHCHKTGTVRKLLCDKCNLALGLIEDNTELLDKMKAYLNASFIS